MKAVVFALCLLILLIPVAPAAGQNEIHTTGDAPSAGRHPFPIATPAAGTPVRIRFATGTIAATRTGHLAPLASDLYVLAAQRGQDLEAFVDAPAALLYVWGPDGSELAPGAGQMAAWRVILPAAGDYFIAVNSTGRATDYKMTVIVDTPAAAGAARIRFAAGTTSATVSGHLAQGAPARYVLWAARGQRLESRIWPAPMEYVPARLEVTVAGPGGRSWNDLALEDVIDPLPASGDYTITLALQPGSPGTNYVMEVTIPAP